MAQKSKKDHIIEIATPLFLQNGFKGTSIDLVVKQSRVSKATVYNHFPNKAALMLAVVTHWSDAHKPPTASVNDRAGLIEFALSYWLIPDAIYFYATIIAEGWRFPEAKALFWQKYDHTWRLAMSYGAQQSGLADTATDSLFNDLLMQRLIDH